MRYYFVIWLLILSGPVFAQGQSKEVSICKGTTVRLRAESTGALRYEWYRDNLVMDGSVTSEITVGDEGTYKAYGVNSNGCASDPSIFIVINHHHPLVVDDIATGTKNKTVVIEVLKNDQSVCTAFDLNSLVTVTAPVNGILESSNGVFVYQPDQGFIGKDSLTYQIRDGSGQLSNIAKVSLEIIPDPMPVTLTYFEARKENSVAVLTWGTAQEINSDHFEIQRSTNQHNWQKIASQKASENSSSGIDYNFTDSLPESGLNYYRLKMVDTDSSFTYSRIRSVHFPEFAWAQVYPNPVEDLLHVAIRNSKVKNMRLIHNTGMIMLSQKISNPSFTIDMRQYRSGLYLIHFEQEDGAVKIFKLWHDR